MAESVLLGARSRSCEAVVYLYIQLLQENACMLLLPDLSTGLGTYS